MLEDTLRRMQDDGLIDKRSEPGPFGATWYSLTPTGYSLLSALRPLAEWAQENRHSRRRQSGDRPAS